MVNNAALTGGSDLPGYVAPFADQSADAFMAASRLNVVAPFLLVQRAQALLQLSPCASVINLSSIYGLVAPNMSLYEGTSMGNPAAYGATKAGLAHLTRYMATVLGPHIRANAIAPGGIARGQNPTSSSDTSGSRRSAGWRRRPTSAVSSHGWQGMPPPMSPGR